MKSLKFLSVLLLAGTLFTSCKKDDAPTTQCRIITITPTSGDAMNFTYNADGKLATYISGTDKTVYNYSGNTVVATVTHNGTFNSKKIITIGANGFTSNVKTETTSDGIKWYNDFYEYSGKELIKQTSTSSQNGNPSITTVQWSNGNLASTTTNGQTASIEYANKPAQTGDYLDIIQLIQGIRIYQSKNLIKSLLSSGGSISNFEYTEDGGKITGLKTSDGNSETSYTYQYSCN